MKYISPNCIRSESGLGAHTSARLAIRFPGARTLYAAGHLASTYIQSLRVMVKQECRTGVCSFLLQLNFLPIRFTRNQTPCSPLIFSINCTCNNIRVHNNLWFQISGSKFLQCRPRNSKVEAGGLIKVFRQDLYNYCYFSHEHTYTPYPIPSVSCNPFLV